MRAAGGTDYRNIRAQNTIRKSFRCTQVSRLLCNAVIPQQPLEAAHHLIGFCYGIFVREKAILFRRAEQVESLHAPVFDNISCKVKITLCAGQRIQSYEGLQDRTGIHSSPGLARLRNRTLAGRRRADPRNDIVCMALQCLEDFTAQRFLPANVQKILHAQHHIFPAPDIPSLEFPGNGIGGKTSLAILYRQQIAHAVFQNFVQVRILRIVICQRSPAHQFSPIFAAPGKIGVIRIPASERLRQPFPDSGIFQLPFLYEPNGSVEHSRKTQRAHGQQFKPIGNHTHIFKPPRRFRFLPEYFPLWYTF